ncbi:MAG TPA: DUF92 domain-containing protein [Roseiflexaceae bacterium]|nr:DUF92 domain-containing protein [Roseiflexaceae bacterium]
MLNLPRILAGLVLSTLIGAGAYWRSSLTRSGWLGAVITGTLTFGFGGWTWGLTLIAFFVSSSVLSHFRQARKRAIVGEKFEKGGRRDLAQALANGGIGAALALAYGLSGAPLMLLAAFVGVMATVTADTWATEIGVLSPHPPRRITSWQPVEPGTSGGVSAYGMLACSAGALAIGGVAMLLAAIELGSWLPWMPPAALLGGLAGSLADSLLGATVQAIYRAPGGGETERRTGRDGAANQALRGWRWMNNDMVNLLSSVVGGLVAVGVYLLIGD